jgi:hypothetical protein
MATELELPLASYSRLFGRPAGPTVTQARPVRRCFRRRCPKSRPVARGWGFTYLGRKAATWAKRGRNGGRPAPPGKFPWKFIAKQNAVTIFPFSHSAVPKRQSFAPIPPSLATWRPVPELLGLRQVERRQCWTIAAGPGEF